MVCCVLGKGTQDKQHITSDTIQHALGTNHPSPRLSLDVEHPTRKLTLGFFTGNTYLQGFKRHCFCELDTKCKRHLVNSKWLDGKKLNLNTLIREAPRSSSEQKIHGSHFLKGSLRCVFYLWSSFSWWWLLVTNPYPSIFCLPHSCLKFLLASAMISLFNSPLDPVPWHRQPSSSALLLWLLLSSRKRLVQQKRGDTVMSLQSSWKRSRPIPGHKGALVGLFISRLVKT